MLRIGLTGGIGSGKSTVAEIFRILGVPVYNADTAARRLMETNAELKTALIREFGEQAYIGSSLNRKFIASIVFNDASRLETLNVITHPAVINDATLWMQQQHAPYIVKEAALMFESASAAGLDLIIGVFAPEFIRIRRVMERDHVSREEVQARIGKQISESLKMKLCDQVLVNDDQQLLIPQVVRLHKTLIMKSEEDIYNNR